MCTSDYKSEMSAAHKKQSESKYVTCFADSKPDLDITFRDVLRHWAPVVSFEGELLWHRWLCRAARSVVRRTA